MKMWKDKDENTFLRNEWKVEIQKWDGDMESVYNAIILIISFHKPHAKITPNFVGARPNSLMPKKYASRLFYAQPLTPAAKFATLNH